MPVYIPRLIEIADRVDTRIEDQEDEKCRGLATALRASDRSAGTNNLIGSNVAVLSAPRFLFLLRTPKKNSLWISLDHSQCIHLGHVC